MYRIEKYKKAKEGREKFEMERSYLLFDDYSHCVCMDETRM